LGITEPMGVAAVSEHREGRVPLMNAMRVVTRIKAFAASRRQSMYPEFAVGL
jgi:hypothetical protein